MAADYHRVYSAFWRETRGWPDDERTLALYLLTCRHRNTEGLYDLPVEYALVDLEWTTDRYETAEGGLAVRGWIVRDGDLVVVTKALRWQPPAGPNNVKGAVRVVAGVPRDSAAWAAFYDAAREWSPTLFERLDKPVRTPFEPRSNPVRASSPDEGTSNGANQGFEPSSSTSSSAPPPSSGGGDAHEHDLHEFNFAPIQRALSVAGYDDLSIEQAWSQIRAELLEVGIAAAEIDWIRFGMELGEKRRAGAIRRDSVIAGVRFVLRSAAGAPRVGQTPAGLFASTTGAAAREASSVSLLSAALANKAATS